MENPVKLSFISVAGMNRPDVKDGLIAEYLVEGVKNKIRTILRIGLENGHDSLVLGALGCGAFRNPPRHVARLFHEVIEEEEFFGCYKLLIFAILDDHNAHKTHNPEGNFKPFAEEFSGMDRKISDEMKALTTWNLGNGISAKRFNGENHMPLKTVVATKDSWKIEPMPQKHVVIPMNVTLPKEAMGIIKCGHIPEAMEDHWFMYCEGNTIRYYRSWSGLCIFVAKYVEEEDNVRITHLLINREPTQYKETDDKKDVALFMALLTEEYGGNASIFWDMVI